MYIEVYLINFMKTNDDLLSFYYVDQYRLNLLLDNGFYRAEYFESFQNAVLISKI